MSEIYLFLPLIVLFIVLFIVFLRFKLLKKRYAIRKNENIEVLEIQVPKNLEVTSVQQASLAAESMYASLHGLLHEDPDLQEHLSFEIYSGPKGLRFFAVIPKTILKFVESQIYAQYPLASISRAEDYATFQPDGMEYEVSTLAFTKEQFFPIRTFRDYETETLSVITSTMSEIQKGEEIWFQVLFKPLPDVWQKEGYDYVNALREGTLVKRPSLGLGSILHAIGNELMLIGYTMLEQIFRSPTAAKAPASTTALKPALPKLSPVQELELKSIENKLSKMGYLTQIRTVCIASTRDRVLVNMRSMAASVKQYATANSNSFTSHSEPNKEESLIAFKERALDESKSFVCNIEELATVMHFPSSSMETPNISWIYSKKSEPPPNLPTKDCNFIGETIFRSYKMRFGVKNGDDRLRHMYLIGKSGTGKSTLFETMISQDIAKGYGVGVLDPHGETIDRVLEYIPEHRIKDVIYFDPSDVERPVGLNLLEMEDMSQKNLMASALVSAIRQHFDYSWGPRLEYLLNYCILTLLEVPGTSMLGITRLLEDDNYRKYILHSVKDPVTVRFWESEYKDMKGNQKLVTEAIAPIQNKVNRFLASTTIRNILGQRKSTLNISDAMNNGKILLMNLSKGKIGADNANLLGALMVSRIQFMALQRAKIPYEQRRPFYLYVDEFQNFATGSFEEILSESRKYKLGLYLTHQFTAQLPEELLKAVYGNVGTIATFSLGAPDARMLASEFAPYFDEEDIISLERFHIYIKLMVDGMTSLPFSAKILLPWDPESGVSPKFSENKQRVIEYSRQTYGVDREVVESKINKWVETKFDKGLAIAQEIKDKKAGAGIPDQIYQAPLS
ncbi:hypothetical protein A3F07_03435 [candidate division WWE3 bacterium RIFCSPHIGHO2_12_FULL_38_15]|uniref:Uncharacterized protein n=1 Tax=candidate division WWE3 bacterium RIFCSPHIGHO2_02_FULL_38_14 TaxID=1802620 RepID=A0A1F4V733_UNCKA|nr:MAG: hypothetical protein A2793_02950 [candidate division WWE3 bacterium RIFCSPHIGHO2_01_FULL_38_45]OGC48854.1 MAG: hypothetical protein A3F07_03435 [candidate division WWE3 bacterium RIFCSPHIGHO2_12_FULL_38_15]OGC52810.1 MAG: hypothetical protein A3D91_02125 [candidate division WWE3 bacterium RIFCSPHIGHO2_02_FULL_38_14]OGC53157.1 MAG: hypothetical protein A3B64_01775 [candidate division WWE3 bacterium RIFCSPLOWO2_01_FULL_37_24]HLB51997.1 DUF87 domain-containing protein [Patescibacteria grou